MEIKGKKIILDFYYDYEFIQLMSHIKKIKHGELLIKIKGAKPYRIIKSTKDILLTKDTSGNSNKSETF